MPSDPEVSFEISDWNVSYSDSTWAGTKSGITPAPGPQKPSRLLYKCPLGNGDERGCFARARSLALTTVAGTFMAVSDLPPYGSLPVGHPPTPQPPTPRRLMLRHSVEDIFSNIDTDDSTIVDGYVEEGTWDQDSVRRQHMTIRSNPVSCLQCA